MAVAERLVLARYPLERQSTPSTAELIRIGNGIDFKSGKYRYVDKVFRQISTEPQFGALNIGPRAVDRYFSDKLGYDVRPDIMCFIRSGDKYFLAGLIEAKIKGLSLVRKLDGFADDFIPHLKQQGHLQKFFEFLDIKANADFADKIFVTFVNRTIREDTGYEDPRFARVNFRNIL